MWLWMHSIAKMFSHHLWQYSRLSHNCRQTSIPTATSIVVQTHRPFDPTRWSFPTTGPRGARAVWVGYTVIGLASLAARRHGPNKGVLSQCQCEARLVAHI